MAIKLRDVDPSQVALRLVDGERLVHSTRSDCTILLAEVFPLRGGRRAIRSGTGSGCCPDPVFIAALRRAHRMLERERGLPSMTSAPVSPYERNILRLAFLAPAIQQDILAGRQPAALTLGKLKQMKIPLAWSEQPAAPGLRSDEDYLLRRVIRLILPTNCPVMRDQIACSGK
ncbi:hypothetical protein [Qipengyuania sp.]|uniref:hypothetical protein n=1 Tax=Qipengyuania sp. TaxID=2004515 RepID=UPI0037360667